MLKHHSIVNKFYSPLAATSKNAMAFAVYEIGDKGGLYEPYNQVNQMHAEQNNYGDAITCDDGPKKKVVLVN